MPAAPVTLQTIADRAGVSRSLVSMALRNMPVVARGTRERIQRVAEELGYRPNPLVRSLMRSLRSHAQPAFKSTLAFVTNYAERDAWRKWLTYPDYFAGAMERGAELGYKVEHFWLREYERHPSRLTGVLKARGIQGLIIAPLPRGNSTLEIDFSEFSAVALGYTLASPNLHRICNHHLLTVEQAMRELAERGYRRIGVAMQSDDVVRVGMLWTAGIFVAQQRMPEVAIQVFPTGNWSEPAFRRWCRRCRPEVIVGVTLEVWEWTRNLGREIPRELGFFHLDCAPGGSMSGMNQHARQLGASAVEILAMLAESDERGPVSEARVFLIGSTVNEGLTVRPRRGDASAREAPEPDFNGFKSSGL